MDFAQPSARAQVGGEELNGEVCLSKLYNLVKTSMPKSTPPRMRTRVQEGCPAPEEMISGFTRSLASQWANEPIQNKTPGFGVS